MLEIVSRLGLVNATDLEDALLAAKLDPKHTENPGSEKSSSAYNSGAQWPVGSLKEEDLEVTKLSSPHSTATTSTIVPLDLDEECAPSRTTSKDSQEDKRPVPMLPPEALLRKVSPAARSAVPREDVSTPKLFLPEAAFARARTPLPESPVAETRKQPRTKTTRVSFQEDTELLLFDQDRPCQLPVRKTVSANHDDSSPRSPRPSQIQLSALTFIQDELTEASPGSPTRYPRPEHESKTPKSSSSQSLALSFGTGSFNLPTSEMSDSEEDGCESPRAGASSSEEVGEKSTADGCKTPTSAAGASGFGFDIPATTPKAATLSLPQLGFGDTPSNVECMTPKASSACLTSLGFGEESPDTFETPCSQFNSDDAFPANTCATPKASFAASAGFNLQCEEPQKLDNWIPSFNLRNTEPAELADPMSEFAAASASRNGMSSTTSTTPKACSPSLSFFCDTSPTEYGDALQSDTTAMSTLVFAQ